MQTEYSVLACLYNHSHSRTALQLSTKIKAHCCTDSTTSLQYQKTKNEQNNYKQISF